VLVSCWGNCRCSIGVKGIDAEYITGEGMFLDLEKNSAIKAEVMRRITTSKGERYNADMIQTTGNAAGAIALRNAVLRGVPKAFWLDMFNASKKVVAGDAKTFVSRREGAMKEIGIIGATPEMVFRLLNIKGIDDLNADHFVTLVGLINAIKEGDMSIEDAFKAPEGAREGEVTPRRPTQSEFTREDKQSGKGGNGKPAETKGEQIETTSKTDTAKGGGAPDPKTETERKEEPQPQEKTETRESTDQVLDKLLAEEIADLDKISRIKDVADRREQIAEQFEGDRLKAWHDACEKRTRTILDATRRPRK
jgi:hypothetical protein